MECDSRFVLWVYGFSMTSFLSFEIRIQSITELYDKQEKRLKYYTTRICFHLFM